MQVALITGSTGGLGETLSLFLDKIGYRIIVHYRNSEDKALRLMGLLKNKPFIWRADMRSSDEVRSMAVSVERNIGRLDVLINNAAITRDGLLIRYNEIDWDDVIDVNLKGVFNSVRHLAPLMITSGGGHIINISSYSGLRGKEGQAAYSASKAALIGLTYTLSKELSGYNIRVNTIIPGYMSVGMGLSTPGAMQDARERSILRVLSSPEAVAQFTGFLIKTSGITGQVFSLESRI